MLTNFAACSCPTTKTNDAITSFASIEAELIRRVQRISDEAIRASYNVMDGALKQECQDTEGNIDAEAVKGILVGCVEETFSNSGQYNVLTLNGAQWLFAGTNEASGPEFDAYTNVSLLNVSGVTTRIFRPVNPVAEQETVTA